MGRLRRVPRKLHTHSPSLQLPVSSSTPLLPKIASQSAANPLLQILKRSRHLAETIIRPPAAQSLAQAFNQAPEAYTQRAARLLLQRPTQCLQRLVADSPAVLPPNKREAEQHPTPRAIDCALLHVYLQLQTL